MCAYFVYIKQEVRKGHYVYMRETGRVERGRERRKEGGKEVTRERDAGRLIQKLTAIFLFSLLLEMYSLKK